jgi:hypothetical protein
MYTIAFEVPNSSHEEGNDVNDNMLRNALLKRIINMDENDIWEECVGGPEDTYEEDDG